MYRKYPHTVQLHNNEMNK